MLAAGLTGGPALAADTGPGLVQMLAMLPDWERLLAGPQIFSYADYRAIERAAGLPQPDSERPGGTSFAALPQAAQAAWQANARRLIAGPEALRAYAAGIAPGPPRQPDLRAVMGFDWFAVDRAISLSSGPEAFVLAGGPELGTFDEADAATLLNRGYVEQDRAGWQIWTRFADETTVYGMTDPAAPLDPFDDDRMLAERIAARPGLLIDAASWGDLDALLARQDLTAPDSDLGRVLAALAGAVTQLDGVDPAVLQAAAFPLHGGADAAAGSQGFGGAGLPRSPVVLVADLAAGADQVNALALPYADHATALQAAATLAMAVAGWAPEGGELAGPVPLADRAGAAIVLKVVDAPELGAALAGTIRAAGPPGAGGAQPDATAGPAAIALVAVRYPLPAPGSGTAPGFILQAWLDAIGSQDFAPLAGAR